MLLKDLREEEAVSASEVGDAPESAKVPLLQLVRDELLSSSET
ncbi:hypothetical protein ACQ4WX_02550 [Streptomyces lasalocidi]